MKRILYLCLALVMVLSSLAACTQKTDSSSSGSSVSSAFASSSGQGASQASSGASSSSSNDASFKWSGPSGYWTSGEKFVGFFYSDDDFRFEYGLYQSSYWIAGEVTHVAPTDENKTTLTLHIPATPASEIEEARPERTETVQLDTSNFLSNGTIEVNIADGGWFTYTFGGATLQKAYDMSGTIARLPDSAAQSTILQRLSGYWAVTDSSGMTYVRFFKDDNSKHWFEYAWFEIDNNDRAEILGIESAGGYKILVTIYFAAVPQDGSPHAGRPELTDTIEIDFAKFYEEGTIAINTRIQIVGGLYDYIYGGETYEQAYETWLN